MINVVLVEDHASYRQALDSVMRTTEDLRVVAHVSSGGDAVARVREARADVVVIDLDLPGGSGIDALADIRREEPDVRCMVLTALTDDVELGRAVEGGAAAVLHKNVEIPDLLDAIRTVAAGGTVLSAEETSRRLQALAASRDDEWYARTLADSLSPREREVLARLAEGKGNTEIAATLGVSPQTVQTHVRNLHAKLNVRSRLEAVTKALRLGLVPPPKAGAHRRPPETR